jgi:hypothetical protein
VCNVSDMGRKSMALIEARKGNVSLWATASRPTLMDIGSCAKRVKLALPRSTDGLKRLNFVTPVFPEGCD